MRKFIAPFLLLLLVVVIFHSWFLPGLLSTFDFPYYSPLMMKDAGIIPYAWGYHVGLDGFAKFISPYSWIMPLINIPQVIFGGLRMDWLFIERVMYLYPFLILMIVSPILLIRYIFPKNNFYLLSVLIFSFNTYALMLAGGEVFLALSYALAPMILMIFIKIVSDIRYQISDIRYSIIAGLLLSVQVMLDPRITYVTISAVALYAVFSILYLVFSKKSLTGINIRRIFSSLILIVIIPGVIAVLLHAFWIIPSVLHGGNPVETLGPAHSTVEAVKYFSFAKFENTISLLQPNWPENIFGKVGFMKPEFLMLPILAFSSFFFIFKTKDQRTKSCVLFFAILGLIGAFLAKGVNDPFGNIYFWMFEHVPGFIMFRDPTKWYLLVAISYSVLIPFSGWKIYEWLKSHNKFSINSKVFNIQNMFLLLLTSYLLILIRPAILGQLGGMFKITNVPDDYVKLEKFLYNQQNFFRTVWVPSKQKFGYYSNSHPEMSAQILFNVTDSKSLFKKLTEKNTEKLLKETSVKYVIVPYDSEKEIFLTDRKYDDKLYKKALSDVSNISYLEKLDGFGKIGVFEVPNPKDHFYISNRQSAIGNQKITYLYVSPVEYTVSVKNAKKGDVIVFSEMYDSKWIAKTPDYTLYAKRYGLFNSFVLPQDGNYTLSIYYSPQKYVSIGIVVSILSLILILSLVTFGYRYKKW